MNTANLQLEGLCMAMVALVRVLERRGVLDAGELDDALAAVERDLAADPTNAELAPANLHAVLFPVRLLRQAAREPRGFSDLARAVAADDAR